MKRILPGFRLFVSLPFLVFISMAAVAQGPAATFIYGINNNNEIVEVDLVGKTNKAVYNTGLSGSSNAFAYDNTRNQFFFLDPSKNLQFWNRNSKLVQIATAAQLGLSSATIPANAAFYDNAYWFFSEGAHVLNKVALTYTGSTPAFSSVTQYGITNTIFPAATNTFGDIAINTSGMLYAVTAAGSGGNFYRLDLTTLVSTLSPTASQNVATSIKSGLTDPEIATPPNTVGLQIGFSSDQAKLFGHNASTGKWYEVNLTNGDLTLVTSGGSAFTTLAASFGLRDVGDLGASTKVELVDLSVTITDNRPDYVPGGTLTYVVTVTNNNISGAVAVPGATLTVTPASGITFGSWTASYSGGGSSSGSGNITDQVLSSLPVGGTVTFTITATVSGSASSSLTTSASLTSPAGYSELDVSNNTASDTDALPLTWGGFSAKADGSDVKLAWSTLMEENTLDFIVQRSQSGQSWSDVGQVNAAGFSQNTRNYSFTDRNVPLGVWQYRLLQRDKGGLSSHSETRSVNVRGVPELLTVYGNPVTNGQFKVSVRENGNMTIVDNMGRTVYQSRLVPGTHTIHTSQWMKGSYNYRFTGSETVTGRVVLQ